MNWANFLVAVLATSAIVEGVRHGSLLSDYRIYWNTTAYFSSRLLRCPFCFSHWAAAFVVLVLMGPMFVFGPGIVTWPGYLLSLVLATVRGANLLSDVTHSWSRSPKREEDHEQPTFGA